VRPLGGAEPDDADRIVDMEQSIPRQHKSALRLAAAPSARDLLELRAELAADFVRPEDAAAEACSLEPVDRLPHLADRAAFQGERLCLDHRLVAVIERVQPVAAIELEPVLGRAEDREPPVALPRVLDEARDELGEGRRRPDRTSRDVFDAADYPVRVE